MLDGSPYPRRKTCSRKTFFQWLRMRGLITWTSVADGPLLSYVLLLMTRQPCIWRNVQVVVVFCLYISDQRGVDNKESARLDNCTDFFFAIWLLHSLLACNQNFDFKGLSQTILCSKFKWVAIIFAERSIIWNVNPKAIITAATLGVFLRSNKAHIKNKVT